MPAPFTSCWDGSEEALQLILCGKAGLELDHEEAEAKKVLLIGFAETHISSDSKSVPTFFSFIK